MHRLRVFQQPVKHYSTIDGSYCYFVFLRLSDRVKLIGEQILIALHALKAACKSCIGAIVFAMKQWKECWDSIYDNTFFWFDMTEELFGRLARLPQDIFSPFLSLSQ